jgi:hypothetical protein
MRATPRPLATHRCRRPFFWQQRRKHGAIFDSALLHIAQFVIVTVILARIAPSFALDAAPYKVAGGLAVYLGMFPAEMITGHPKGHTEAEMHGGVSAGRHLHHVMVAIFAVADGQRITDAVVTANVAGLGLAGEEKALEPMTVADALTYGAYFNLPGRDRYRIRIEIRRPGATRPVKVEFDYDHQV